MLTWRRGWHYRRTVPEKLRAAVGCREVWVSPGTSSKRLAQKRALPFQACVGELLAAGALLEASMLNETEAELIAVLTASQKTAAETVELQADVALKREQLCRLREALAQATAATMMRDTVANLRPVINQLVEQSYMHIGRMVESRDHRAQADRTVQALTEALARVSLVPTGGAAPPVASGPSSPSSEPFSDLAARFLQSKEPGWTAQTIHQARMTYRLWTELMGDSPVAAVTGREAGKFLELLRRLPATHSKSRVPLLAKAAIARADAKPGTTARLSEKTVKRHASALSQLWLWLLPQDLVTHNVFEGFRFSGAGRNRNARSDWSDTDLLSLLSAPWIHARIPAGSYAWLTLVAMYSGMRLEEIARLRPEDVRMVEGIAVILIRSHPDGWSPKTEAGERTVPVHPTLARAGFLEMVEQRRRQGAGRVVAGLNRSGPDRKFGTEFSKAFSRHKMRAGVDGRTTFHSFRHSASTILRNADAELRSVWIDWLLGHEGNDRSQGASTYLKRIDVQNLARTIVGLRWAPEIEAAALHLVKINGGVQHRAIGRHRRRAPSNASGDPSESKPQPD